MRRGFLFLVAVMDWYSRKILSWRLSNTMHADFCIEALQEAITRYGKPEIVNTDQGSQFTCLEFIEVLKTHEIAISMDGKGCLRDNVLIERFWRTIKYQEVYLKAYESASDERHPRLLRLPYRWEQRCRYDPEKSPLLLRLRGWPATHPSRHLNARKVQRACRHQ
jgi:transposase InsO family protein